MAVSQISSSSKRDEIPKEAHSDTGPEWEHSSDSAESNDDALARRQGLDPVLTKKLRLLNDVIIYTMEDL